MEVAVGDEEAVEQGAEDVGLEPWGCSSYHFCCLLASSYGLSYVRYGLTGCVDFVLGYGGTVDVEAWEAHVGVGHGEGEDGVRLAAEQAGEGVVGIADVIATGHDNVEV